MSEPTPQKNFLIPKGVLCWVRKGPSHDWLQIATRTTTLFEAPENEWESCFLFVKPDGWQLYIGKRYVERRKDLFDPRFQEAV